MTNQEKQKLNEKLARHFLGIKKIYYDEEWDTEKTSPMYIPSGKPWRTHKIDARPIPDFTSPDYGIAYCFKWLVPKVGKVGISFSPVGEQWMCDLESQNIRNAWRHTTKAETVSLAFCLAIEKLIEVME